MDKTVPSTYGSLRFDVGMLLKAWAQKQWTIAELRNALGLPDTKQSRNVVFQTLFKMERAGEIIRVYRGVYMWAAHTE